ncbi:MAG: tyrosine-type recombinase/integrase [Planctomycetota bacterium]|nr:tyrosine-type recombinase/integrase [Planctomycetota bacterium]
MEKRDLDGTVVHLHALRHSFGTHLSKAGVAPRVAQAAMRHIDIALTINTYTDARLLDTAEAVEALPSLPLDGAIGAPRTDAPMDAPQLGKESHIESHPEHSGDCGDDTQGTRKRRE